MKIGLFFGSFNPIHHGHLAIAQYLLDFGGFDKVRFVVSPQNPFKEAEGLWPEEDRLEWARLAIEGHGQLEVSDLEFGLPRPSYTYLTLRHMIKAEPHHKFGIVMGSDNAQGFTGWRDWEEIAKLCELHVYRRRGSESFALPAVCRVQKHEGPYFDLSATYIRELVAAGKSARYLVPEKVRMRLGR